MKTKVLSAIFAVVSMLFTSCSRSNMTTVDKVYLLNGGELTMITSEDVAGIDSTGNVSSKKELTYFELDLKKCFPDITSDGISIIKDGVIKNARLAYVIHGKTAFVYLMEDGKLNCRYLSESEFKEITKETLKYLKQGINVMVE